MLSGGRRWGRSRAPSSKYKVFWMFGTPKRAGRKPLRGKRGQHLAARGSRLFYCTTILEFQWNFSYYSPLQLISVLNTIFERDVPVEPVDDARVENMKPATKPWCASTTSCWLRLSYQSFRLTAEYAEIRRVFSKIFSALLCDPGGLIYNHQLHHKTVLFRSGRL